jgi:hypothetical protein
VKLFPGSGLTIDGAVNPFAAGIPDEEGGGVGFVGDAAVPGTEATVRLGVSLNGSAGSSTLQPRAARRRPRTERRITTLGFVVRALSPLLC